MLENFLVFLISVITAIIASYSTAQWSLKKFYSEKWWERKERAYTEIIDALYDLLQYCEIQKGDFGQGSGYSENKMKLFREKYNQAYWKIKKATDIGAFVVSSEAEIALKELRDRQRPNWDDYDLWDIYEDDYKYYQNTLEKIVNIARIDLKAKKNLKKFFNISFRL